MPLTTLDPKTALIVIDLQKLIAGLPVLHPFDEIVERSAKLAKACRRHGLPVVLVNVDGVAPGRTEGARLDFSKLPADFAEIVAELGTQPDDIRVTKKTWGAFVGTGLEKTLRDLGVTQVILAGISTSAGVESTARQAFEAGFNVTLATDAMTDTQAEAHERAISHIFPRLGECGTTDEILALLERSRV